MHSAEPRQHTGSITQNKQKANEKVMALEDHFRQFEENVELSK